MPRAVLCDQCGKDLCVLVRLGTLARMSSFGVVCHDCYPAWSKEQARKRRVAEKQKRVQKTQIFPRQEPRKGTAELDLSKMM